MKVLQQGFNVREATLIGILCGSIIGYNFAEEDKENIKDKLFNAFKNNNLYNNRMKIVIRGKYKTVDQSYLSRLLKMTLVIH